MDPMWDGAALTAEGCVLDLDGGRAVFFAFDKELSSGFEAGERAKRDARRLRLLRQDQLIREAAARVLADDICSIDEGGVLHGMLPSKSVDVDDRVVLCATADGPVSIFLYLNVDNDIKLEHRRLARQKMNCCNSTPCTMVLDENGTIQDITDPE